jgi:3-hydroxyisobutyrate dehydrogenase
MMGDIFGFIGLGNMGQPMAWNIISAGLSLIVHDTAGTMERSSNGAVLAQSNQEVARKANGIVLSLPNLESNRSVVHEIATVGQVGSIIVVHLHHWSRSCCRKH